MLVTELQLTVLAALEASLMRKKHVTHPAVCVCVGVCVCVLQSSVASTMCFKISAGAIAWHAGSRKNATRQNAAVTDETHPPVDTICTAHRRLVTLTSRLRNDLYCVEWDVKLYYTISYVVIS